MEIAARPAAHDEARSTTLALLDETLGAVDAPDVGVRLWDGTRWPDHRPRAATLVLRHPGALRRMFLPGTELGLGRAFLRDDFDVEGDVETLLEAARPVGDRLTGLRRRLKIARQLVRLPATGVHARVPLGRARLKGRRHSIERDSAAIRYHYDVSNEFYALWLDARMVYSCAYFREPDMTLEEAQEAKLDLVCRKLRLRPGQRLLDVGCGWGGLVMHAAERYGVDATGVTLSERQAALARERIAKAGLEDKARVLVQDYREIEAPPFDAVVSVGMFEHVGQTMLPAYFAKAFSLLRPRGVFLNHGISSMGKVRGADARSFIDAYVFPDGELVPVETSLAAAAGAGFEIRDVESLREHYALTLREWVRRLESRHEDAVSLVGEPAYRIWRLYMAGSAGSFDHGRINVYQTLLSKPDAQGRSGLPMTREDWLARPST
jgi:cyclopropane-fatty-acyl-phospholipid synthase